MDAFETALEEGRSEDAVRAYGGPFLGAFYVSDAPEFERWAETERDRLAGAYGRALESLAASAESAGDLLQAAEWWRRLAQHDPFSSRVALRLARTLWDAGERAAALRAAEAHVAWLREELGVGPEPELVELVARLRAESLPLPAGPRRPCTRRFPPARRPAARAPTIRPRTPCPRRLPSPRPRRRPPSRRGRTPRSRLRA